MNERKEIKTTPKTELKTARLISHHVHRGPFLIFKRKTMIGTNLDILGISAIL